MKSPDRCRPVPHQAQKTAPQDSIFGVSCYRRPTIGASPTTFHTVSEGEFSEVHIHEPVLVLTHRAGYPTQEHGRFLLGLEKYPRPPDALGSGAWDATQRSARPRRPARLLLPALLLPVSHLPRFPDWPRDRQPRGRPEEPV